MLLPTEYDLRHLAVGYDPVKAHEYYLRTRKLKGRRRGSDHPSGVDPRTGKTMDQIQRDAKTKQRQELSARIQSLSAKLQKLEAKIRQMQAEEARENRKSKAKKERAAKERDKPKSAAEKAEAARESKKYRERHKQELKAKRASRSGGGSSKTGKRSSSKANSISELKALATKVRGQIAVAKQKLAAL